MQRALLILFCLVCWGCSAEQPASARAVAAFEAPVSGPAERAEFLEIVKREAQAEGLHVDVTDDAYLKRVAEAMPAAAETVRAGVWRGEDDDQFEASISDGAGHTGDLWIVFVRGEDPQKATQARERIMRGVRARWPNTASLPIMPTGTIPLKRDLRLTPEGYRIEPAEAARYGLSSASPLIAKP